MVGSRSKSDFPSPDDVEAAIEDAFAPDDTAETEPGDAMGAKAKEIKEVQAALRPALSRARSLLEVRADQADAHRALSQPAGGFAEARTPSKRALKVSSGDRGGRSMVVPVDQPAQPKVTRSPVPVGRPISKSADTPNPKSIPPRHSTASQIPVNPEEGGVFQQLLSEAQTPASRTKADEGLKGEDQRVPTTPITLLESQSATPPQNPHSPIKHPILWWLWRRAQKP